MSQQSSFIYNFLLAPQFRILRYITLLIFFTIISVNQVLIGYGEIALTIGNRLYLIIGYTILIYLVTVYLFSKIAGKLLLSKKYLKFICCIILSAIFFTVISNITDYYYMPNFNFFSGKVLIDNLSSLIIYIICISGVIIPIFLRNWIAVNQHINQLKIKMETSQVEQLKEQINPQFFFKILNQSGVFVNTEPDKASSILMKLSQVLRYQLYDCNRNQVLITAEISFLRNFLDLEILCSSKFDYTITTSGNINGIFIPPSILLPYVQNTINIFENDGSAHILDILVSNLENSICITLKVSGITNIIMLEKGLLKVKERLNTLYKKQYIMTFNKDKSTGKAEVALLLNKK